MGKLGELVQALRGNGIGRVEDVGGASLRYKVRQKGQRIAAGVICRYKTQSVLGVSPHTRQDKMAQQDAALQQPRRIVTVIAVVGGKQR